MAMNIAGNTAQQIKDKLDTEHWASKLLSEVVCSSYWGGAGVDLRECDRLDQGNWELAKGIMEYRRQEGWNDEAFYSLAMWCKTRHRLAQWDKAD